mgnify:CR=1 FL=1|jgi:excisionase family DNA binding protein
MQIINGEEYLEAAEVVALLKVKRATLYSYVSRGILNSYKQGVGRQRLYKRSEVEALLAIRPNNEPQHEGPKVSLPLAETWTGDH